MRSPLGRASDRSNFSMPREMGISMPSVSILTRFDGLMTFWATMESIVMAALSSVPTGCSNLGPPSTDN